ncbi:uncharacterized protein A1O9_10040, partial [Exophiala aquamarina CBS 119918]
TGINIAQDIRVYIDIVEHIVRNKNAGIGGIWFESRYPGCRCDVPSHNYQIDWTDRTVFFTGPPPL